jgi:predicted GNAT superfamily acetyltransferase
MTTGPGLRSFPELSFRDLVTAHELAALPPFEHRIWGGEGDAVSVNMLVAVIAEGGVAIGAFEGPDIVGAVFGFPTREPNVLHSHYMAVEPAWRRRGLGAELKQRQRLWCLDRGITAMRWTYDPLQLANAHLNLRTLGAVGVHYHVDHYGTLGGINGDLPSDRVTVQWELVGHRVAPVADRYIDVLPVAVDDIASSNAVAMGARLDLRERLLPLMEQGWRLVDVDREGRRYGVAPPSSKVSASTSPSSTAPAS